MLDVMIKGALGQSQFDIKFTAKPGVTALFGPSGAGKTTVANAIAGLWRPAEGRIAFGAEVWFDSALGVWVPPHKRKLGYVFQDARLFPHLSVAQNLRYGGAHDWERLITLLDLTPLLDRKPAHLSGGQKQRVALARALMRAPDVVVMDEPLASLDAPRKAEILPYLSRLRDISGVPIIYISHAMAEVAELATDLVLIDQGHVRDAGPLNAVLTNPANLPLLGPRDRGAVLHAEVTKHDKTAGLTELTFAGGTLRLPGQVGRLQQMLSLHIPAQDVILAHDVPQAMSALNALPARVVSLSQLQSGSVIVSLEVGETQILSQITQHSANALKLDEGQSLFAIIKATAMGASRV
jgi:molybdate transport system ATP-binding protein